MGENKLKNIILSQLESNSMVTITDDLGRVEYANNVFCKTLEYDSDKVVGESHTLFKSHLHSDPLYKGLWRTLKMGKTWKGTLSETLSNGKEIWLDATIIPFKTKKEKHTRYLAIYNDVTQYKLDNKNLKEENIKSKKERQPRTTRETKEKSKETTEREREKRTRYRNQKHGKPKEGKPNKKNKTSKNNK